jgi:glycosyltransferase involved in cell wall biosynthesis
LAGSGRLGIYVDDVYRVAGGTEPRISTDRAFLIFACEVGASFEGCVLFGRTVHSSTQADYVLPRGVGLVELPHYRSLSHVGEVIATVPRTLVAMWKGLRRVDTVWIFGPHVFAVLLVGLSLLRRKRVVLGVRQDTMAYHRSRLPGRRWSAALGVIWLVDRLYRFLARRLPVAVVGSHVAQQYGGARPSLLEMTVSLVRAAEVVPAPAGRDWSHGVELLTVGRIDEEKHPLLLLDVLGRLQKQRPDRYSLAWVGRGPLEELFTNRAAALALARSVELRGYVPYGPELLDLYRNAHAFVHCSRTEGIPQVLIEAMASGIPIVATAVGGVSSLLGHGAAGILVPPDDADALAEAILRISDDDQLRRRLVEEGLRVARGHTFEREVARVVEFVTRTS